MKNNIKHNASGNGSANQSVRLEFIHPAAKSVSVAGTFNDWRPGATEMVSVGDGRWLKELVLAPGVYEYRLVVDGEWMPDPQASETAPNPFGASNSVLRVNGDVRANRSSRTKPCL
jgi:1,4-alpha-glucan branching enzyme